MGYEIPASIGVRLAQDGGEVFAYLGDGTFMLNPGDLVTAFQEGLKITVVVSENHGFQSIRRLQMLGAGRSFGNEFRARNGGQRLEGPYLRIDLGKVAAGLGAVVFGASSTDELRDALDEARDESGPCAIVCQTEPHRYLPESGVWWDIAPAEVSADTIVNDLRAAYERDKGLQRFFC
jgi:3D-(3,5/4)-trihydroxycyclohexane-1,2-dione acylhydrolase (decyclizing)